MSNQQPTLAPAKPWFVYMIECEDDSIYTGIATDVAARFAAHAAGKGARYTRSHRPKRLLAVFETADRSAALKYEIQIKKLTARQKRALAETAVNTGCSVLPSQKAPLEPG